MTEATLNKKNQILISCLAFCILGGAALLTIALISPPAPLPIEAPATEFSAGRAIRDLEVIAREPHPMGVSQAHAEVRDYLLTQIRALGLEPLVQKTVGERVINPGFICGGMVENILVRLPGTNPEGAILLSSHYDSTPGGPGGVDSGSGVVTILEILRALKAGHPLRQDVIFFFSDGEEPCIIGANAFVTQHFWFADVRLAINMDQFSNGLLLLVRTSQGNGLWVQALARSVTGPTFMSMPTDLFSGGETDLAPFERAGIRGVDIQTIVLNAENHTALDRPQLVDPARLQQAGGQMLALVQYLGDETTLKTSAPDQTYFPVLGKLVHYPTSWALPLMAMAGLCFLGTMIFGFYKRQLTWRGLGVGFLTFLLSLALSVMIANLLWLVIQALHPGYGYALDRTHLSDDGLYAVGFFILTLAVYTAAIAFVRKKITALDLAAGVLVFWFPGSIAASLIVPATSYLITWVLLSGSLALLLAFAVQSKKNAQVLSGLGFLASAILTIFLWVPVVYCTFLVPSFPLLSLMVGITGAMLGAVLPALDWITYPKRWLLPASALVVGFGFLFTGNFVVGKNSPPPPVEPIGYWLDVNNYEANWIAFSDDLDERQTNLLRDRVRRAYTDLFPKAPPYSILTSEAPKLSLEGPGLEVISDEWGNNLRKVKIRFTTSMHDRLYIVIPNAPLLAITIPNNERTVLAESIERWLRFDGMPVEGMEICFEFSGGGPVRVLLVEEKTGLPTFPGLSTQPEPGTMKSPGEFLQGIATDFTAIYRSYEVPAFGDE